MGDKQRWHTLPGKEGVLYREHPTRKHGRGPDRCLSIRYRVGEGKRVHESLGWTSEGWTVAKAVALLRELKENIRTGCARCDPWLRSRSSARPSLPVEHR